jgi:glycosyltransferase involved in cell wall biosynthesis
MSKLPSSSNRSPEVSIVIPFYNPGPFFLPALKSVFAQTFTDWELLLIDDGSTDGSLEIAQRLDDDRVTVVTDGYNRGQSCRANIGAGMARGEYLFRLDADDMMHPLRLDSQLKVLRSLPPQTVVGSACYSIDKNSTVIGWRPVSASHRTGFAARHSFVHPTVAASTEWFRSNPYSEDSTFRRAEDAELWCRTASHTKFSWMSQPLAFYREMGVFSLTNYLGDERGLLVLIKQYETSVARRLRLGLRERAMMGIAWTLDKLHQSDLLVRHRHVKLTADQQTEAQKVINEVMLTQIPLR